MGVWAFYKGLPQRDLDAIRADVQQPIEEIALSDEPTVQCEIGKAWYRLHEILTQGLTEPTENNIYSNAVAGQYYMWGDNSEWGDDIWWWDCYSGAFNDNKRVRQISQVLNTVDFKNLYQLHVEKHVNNDPHIFEAYDWLAECFEELKEFYAKCAELNYAVWASFG